MRRQRAEQSELLRLVVDPQGLVHVDYRGRLPGRGAWVSPDREAIEQLERKPGLLSRSFKSKVDTRGLLGRVQMANRAAVDAALSLASRAVFRRVSRLLRLDKTRLLGKHFYRLRRNT